MKTIEIDNIQFKIREFVPFTDLGNVNLYGIYSISVKQGRIIHPYCLKNPQNGDESTGDYQIRLQNLLTEEDQDQLQKLMVENITFMQPLIDVIVMEPPLKTISAGTGLRLQKHPEIQVLIAAFMKDLQEGLGGGQNTSKKV